MHPRICTLSPIHIIRYVCHYLFFFFSFFLFSYKQSLSTARATYGKVCGDSTKTQKTMVYRSVYVHPKKMENPFGSLPISDTSSSLDIYHYWVEPVNPCNVVPSISVPRSPQDLICSASNLPTSYR